jgi:hypothetical protein
MTNKRNQEALTVKDIIEILQISRTGAYLLVNENPPFTVISIGKSIRIPAKSFFAWLDGTPPEKPNPTSKIA